MGPIQGKLTPTRRHRLAPLAAEGLSVIAQMPAAQMDCRVVEGLP
jgi:hypothetical protein